ncbi:MAG: hypothetical protein V4565_01795 [Bacteroidota bacterium]
MYERVICSPFIEHPIVDVALFDAGEFDVTIIEKGASTNFRKEGIFDLTLYCQCLLQKLFSLPKSKIKPFIQYQCMRVNDSLVWINKLEKLMDLNHELFATRDQKIKRDKVLMVIELLRQDIECREQVSVKQFDFNAIKHTLTTYDTPEEQLRLLYEAQADYLQNKPRGAEAGIPFDEKCRVEIEKIENLRLLKKKGKHRETNVKLKTASNRLVIRGQINILVDAFYQMLHEKKANGQSYLSANASQITQFIVNNFVDKDEQPLSESTVRTMLSPNKVDKRPKMDRKVLL